MSKSGKEKPIVRFWNLFKSPRNQGKEMETKLLW